MSDEIETSDEAGKEPQPAEVELEFEAEPEAEAEAGAEADRRRYARRGIRDMPLVQPVRGEVVEMSASGVAVLTWDALPVNKELYLSFGPPGQRVRVRARVVWCRLRATEPGVDWTPKYKAGIQFLEFPS